MSRNSLQQFREWATSVGQTGNPSGDSYRGQCVSLVQQYLNQVFDIPYAARGNAKDFAAPTFTKYPGNVGRLPGDIIRYGSNYGGGYGHIGIIDDNGQFLDQNGTVAMRVGIRAVPFGGIESVWRPTQGFNVKTPLPPQPSGDGRKGAKGTARVLVANLNVRSEPSTGAPVVASYAAGQTFTYDSFIITNGFVWLSYIGGSGARRYVAEGPYDGNPNNVYVSGGV